MKARRLLPLFLVIATLAPAAWASPEIHLEGDRVWVEGLTPNGSALVFGITRERHTWRTSVAFHRQLLTDEEGGGQVELEVARGVPPASVWGVVDLTSGQVSVAVPDGHPRRERAVPTRERLDLITSDFRYAAVVVVRPGRGAWSVLAGDGGASDSDGLLDGTIEIAPEEMTPLVEGSGTLEALQPGDVVVTVDPKGLRFSVERVIGGTR